MRWIALLTFVFCSALLAPSAQAASKNKIDRRVEEALVRFNEEVRGGDELIASAAGVLIFPKVVKAGLGIGGEHGQGALRVGGQNIEYYRLVSGSIGWQLGAQVKTELILFMNQEVLDNFRRHDGWEAGVDASVAVVTLGAGGEIDTHTIDNPILGFIISNKGLMYNLTFEGAKISKIDK